METEPPPRTRARADQEHIKQRNLDSKRLMQRNRNVQGVLESKQAVESMKVFTEIKKNLSQTAFRAQIGEPPLDEGKKRLTTTQSFASSAQPEYE